jgi:hypothetical protein
MRGIAFAFILAGPILVNSDVAKAATNVALGKPLVLNGDYGVLVNNCCGWDPSDPVAPATSLVDGTFLPVSHIWQDDSVWWDATNLGSANNSIEIDLMLDHFIDGFIVQADDNDAYRIEYLDTMNSWISAWEIPVVGGFGMQTRPNTADNAEVFALPTPIQTDRLRFTAVSGDGFYGVSEIQAFGVAVALVDIKPGSFPNSVNLKSKGVLPVAILGTDEFDVTEVAFDTLMFGDPNGGIAVSPLRSALEDVSGDGIWDLSLKFSTAELVANDALGLDTTEGLLTGALLDGTLIEGMDSIQIVPPSQSSALLLAAVPEPTTCTLALAALCLMVGRRRGRSA